jgi:hypothetical protein
MLEQDSALGICRQALPAILVSLVAGCLPAQYCL